MREILEKYLLKLLNEYPDASDDWIDQRIKIAEDILNTQRIKNLTLKLPAKI